MMVALFRHKTEQRAPTPIPPLEDRLAVWQAEDERLSHLLGLVSEQCHHHPFARPKPLEHARNRCVQGPLHH